MWRWRGYCAWGLNDERVLLPVDRAGLTAEGCVFYVPFTIVYAIYVLYNNAQRFLCNAPPASPLQCPSLPDSGDDILAAPL